MIKREDVYKIGVLGKPHGVRGELQFRFTDYVFDRVEAQYLVLDLEGILVPFFMEEYRFRTDEQALVKFCNIDTEERAQDLAGADVYFPRSFVPDDTERLSWTQIIGFSLIDSRMGNVIGNVESVDDSTVNILFEVRTKQGKMLLLPANEDLIMNVNSKKKTIEMEIPEGLLEL